MKRNAFTLIELLVVVTIIVLLIAILLPSFARARSVSRQAVCATNLHSLFEGMQLARQSGGGLPINHAFPGMEWPAIPSTVLASQRVFRCPEAMLNAGNSYGVSGGGSGGSGGAGGSGGPSDDYTVVSNQSKDQYGNPNPMSFPLAAGVNVAVVVGPYTNPGNEYSADNYLWPNVLPGHIQYRIDDGYVKDLDDIVMDFDTGTRQLRDVVPGYHGTNGGKLALYKSGQPVPGWEDIGSKSDKDAITLDSPMTNYGINYLTAQPTVAGDTIVLLDYDLLTANNGETPSMLSHLQASSRHSGKINVLYADGSVRASWGLSLDKTISPGPWSP